MPTTGTLSRRPSALGCSNAHSVRSSHLPAAAHPARHGHNRNSAGLLQRCLQAVHPKGDLFLYEHWGLGCFMTSVLLNHRGGWEPKAGSVLATLTLLLSPLRSTFK